MGRDSDPSPERLPDAVDPRPVIVCAVPLKRAAMERLRVLLDGVRLVDMRTLLTDASAVLTPSCSPQLIGRLKALFPSARIVVVELEDIEHRIDLGGPVTRLRKAGADAYLLADSLEQLARQLRPATGEPEAGEPEAGEHRIAALPSASGDDLVTAAIRRQLAAREAAQAARAPGAEG